MKTLILMRHGDAPNVKEGDRFRLLSQKGIEQSMAAGLYLNEKQMLPDCIFYSPVQRTEKTADWVISSFGFKPKMISKPELYQASKEKILNVIEECPQSVSNLLLIAHNPGISECARFLPIEKHNDSQFLKNFVFPEAGLLIFTYDITDWSFISVTDGKFLAGWLYNQHPMT